jgi:peptide/nickel transport system ATP-binding protein
VEVAPRRELFSNPCHPYTKALLASAPSPDLDHPLDFAAIADGKDTDPANWPAPFDEPPGSVTELISIGGDHYVRAREVPAAAHPMPKREAV